MSERELIARGMEHRVWKSKKGNPDIVLKTPRLANHLSLLGFDPASKMRQELAEAKVSLTNTDIRIPRTLIYGVSKRIIANLRIASYVIGQKHIREDGSIHNHQGHLESQGLPSLVQECKHEPKNFISEKGTLYWVDPTRGMMGRVLERTGLIKLEDYRKFRAKHSWAFRLLDGRKKLFRMF